MKIYLEITLNSDRLSGHAEARRLVHNTCIRACNNAVGEINRKQSELGLGSIIEKVKLAEFPLDLKGVINIGIDNKKSKLPSGAFT